MGVRCACVCVLKELDYANDGVPLQFPLNDQANKGTRPQMGVRVRVRVF